MFQEDEGFMLDLKYRYLAEDVPTGLCFAKGLAKITGIKTPTMNKLVTRAQERTATLLQSWWTRASSIALSAR